MTSPLALAAAIAEHSAGGVVNHGYGIVPGWGTWSLLSPPEIILIALLAAFSFAYANAYRRAKARSADVGAGHWVPYAAGIAIVFFAVCSPVDAIGDSWLLSVHLLQHVLLADVAPALIVLGLRAPMLPLGLPKRALATVAPKGSRFGKALRIATSPWVVLPLWVATTWVWAIPSVFDFSAEHPYVHALEHTTLFYTGLALWWLIIDPLPRARMRPNVQRLGLLLFSRMASAFVCVPLMWITKPEYPLYASAPRAFGLSAIQDQRLGGAGMCFIEFFVFGLAFAVVFFVELGRSETRQALAERAEQAA